MSTSKILSEHSTVIFGDLEYYLSWLLFCLFVFRAVKILIFIVVMVSVSQLNTYVKVDQLVHCKLI